MRAVIISVAALAVPFLASQWSVEASSSVLVWLVALIPAFLLAYYRGWQGAATALAAAMATLALSNVALVLRGGTINELWLLGLISAFIALSLGLGALSEALHAKREQAELVALTDELTALPNRRRIRMYLEQQAARYQGDLSIVLFDLDNFKAYNDEHGHPAGDVVLCKFAEVLEHAIPADGMAARYGGEEFMAVLSNCNERSAAEFAERVRTALSKRQPDEQPVTVCAGVAGGSVGKQSPNELIVLADRALYRAKTEGRNCVRRASTLIATAGKGT